MGCPKGFEPSTSRVTTWHSNQLNYGHHILLFLWKQKDYMKNMTIVKKKSDFYNLIFYINSMNNFLDKYLYYFTHAVLLNHVELDDLFLQVKYSENVSVVLQFILANHAQNAYKPSFQKLFRQSAIW